MSDKAEIRRIFTENLNRLFIKKGTTQRELARYMGVSAPTVNDWLKGKVVPRMEKVDKLCAYFMVKRSDLLEIADPSPTPPLDAEYIEKYKSLNAAHKDAINNQIDYFISREEADRWEKDAGA